MICYTYRSSASEKCNNCKTLTELKQYQQAKLVGKEVMFNMWLPVPFAFTAAAQDTDPLQVTALNQIVILFPADPLHQAQPQIYSG